MKEYLSYLTVNTSSICYLNRRKHLRSPPNFSWRPRCSFFKFFYVVLLCVFTFWVPSCDVCYDFRLKTMFGSSLPPVVCMRAHILFTLFVFVRFVFTSCLIYFTCVCLVRLYIQWFVGGLMSYLHYLCLLGSSLPPVVCRRAHVLFTLFVFVWFVFTSSGL